MYESRPSHAGPLPSIVAVSAILFTTAVSAQGLLGTQQGKGGSAAQGAAGTSGSTGDDGIQKCAKPMGAVAVVEPQDHVLRSLTSYGLQSPVGLIRLMIQQSNCFVVVERGRAMDNMMQERELAKSGELRSNSKFGGGQMVSADYSLSPSITFSNNNAGGAGAAIGGLFGSVGALVGGSLSAKEASTLLTLVDNRSGVQLAASEGSAKNWDFGAMGGLLGSGFGGVGGGYSNTAEGKVIVAAFLDSYSGIVKAVQNYKAQNVKGGLGTGGNLAVQGSESAGQKMTLRDAQSRLNELGFEVGTPDGRMGAKTRSQLSKFQQSRRIPVTGVLDQATSDELSR